VISDFYYTDYIFFDYYCGVIKIGLADYVCSIQLGIKNSITRAQGRHLHDVWLKNIWQLERGQKLLKYQ